MVLQLLKVSDALRGSLILTIEIELLLARDRSC